MEISILFYLLTSVEVDDRPYKRIQFLRRPSTTFQNGPIEAMKQRLNVIKNQGINLHNIYRSFFHLFYTKQTLGFPKFFIWCINKYSLSERVIMNLDCSTILCPANSSIVRKTMSVPEEFTSKDKYYTEESILRCFKESTIERKQFFLRDIPIHHSQSMQPCLMKKPSV